MVKKTRGKYGYFSIVIHRARISNYDVTGRERTVGPVLSVLACAKNSQNENVGPSMVARLPRILREDRAAQ